MDPYAVAGLPFAFARDAERRVEAAASKAALAALDATLASDTAALAVDRIVRSDLIERAVDRLFDTRVLDEVVARLLESKDLWILVDEIARSPAVTEAIGTQSLGFADQIAGVVRDRSRTADDRVERAARRVLRRKQG
jgi:folate-dependent tRNA-U54 methylase TrmFO/GidA